MRTVQVEVLAEFIYRYDGNLKMEIAYRMLQDRTVIEMLSAGGGIVIIPKPEAYIRMGGSPITDRVQYTICVYTEDEYRRLMMPMPYPAKDDIKPGCTGDEPMLGGGR